MIKYKEEEKLVSAFLFLHYIGQHHKHTWPFLLLLPLAVLLRGKIQSHLNETQLSTFVYHCLCVESERTASGMPSTRLCSTPVDSNKIFMRITKLSLYNAT